MPVTHHAVEALPSLAMSYQEYVDTGALLEVRVPGLVETLWLVPTDREIPTDIPRGRVWTAEELFLVLGTGVSPEAFRTVAEAKIAVAGEIVTGNSKFPVTAPDADPISHEVQPGLPLGDDAPLPPARPSPHRAWRDTKWGGKA